MSEDWNVSEGRAVLDLCLDAFQRARQRVEAAATNAMQRRDEDIPLFMYVPLAEAVWWCTCVDEALEQAQDGYKSARNNSPDGQVVYGLRYARSFLGHRQTVAARRGGGLTWPVTFPITYPRYVAWLPVDELPQIDQQTRVRPIYGAHVGGRKVTDTMEAADRWLTARTSCRPA